MYYMTTIIWLLLALSWVLIFLWAPHSQLLSVPSVRDKWSLFKSVQTTREVLSDYKDKVIPVQALEALRVARVSGFHIFRHSALIWRQVCQPYAPAAFYPQEDSRYSFLLEAESTAGPYWHYMCTHIYLNLPVFIRQEAVRERNLNSIVGRILWQILCKFSHEILDFKFINISTFNL
jgi:hypothetical protein